MTMNLWTNNTQARFYIWSSLVATCGCHSIDTLRALALLKVFTPWNGFQYRPQAWLLLHREPGDELAGAPQIPQNAECNIEDHKVVTGLHPRHYDDANLVELASWFEPWMSAISIHKFIWKTVLKSIWQWFEVFWRWFGVLLMSSCHSRQSMTIQVYNLKYMDHPVKHICIYAYIFIYNHIYMYIERRCFKLWRYFFALLAPCHSFASSN